MAKEQQVYEIIRQAGFAPLEDRAIIVKYAPKNLSASVASFFSTEYYVLQMCDTELIMVPFGKISLALKKEVALEIPLSTIHSVEVVEDGFSYRITIKTDEDTVTLSAQQKELSELRSSGVLSFPFLSFPFLSFPSIRRAYYRPRIGMRKTLMIHSRR